MGSGHNYITIYTRKSIYRTDIPRIINIASHPKKKNTCDKIFKIPCYSAKPVPRCDVITA